MANASNAWVGYYMAVNNTDAVGGTTNARWPGAVGSGEVVASAAKATAVTATATKVAIESITVLGAHSSASTVTLRNHADSADLPGGVISIPATSVRSVPHTLFFGASGLPVDGGFCVKIDSTNLNILVHFRIPGV